MPLTSLFFEGRKGTSEEPVARSAVVVSLLASVASFTLARNQPAGDSIAVSIIFPAAIFGPLRTTTCERNLIVKDCVMHAYTEGIGL